MPETPDNPLPKLGKISLDGQSVDIGFYLQKAYDDVGEASTELPSLIEWLNEQLQVFTEERNLAEHGIDVARAKAYFDLKGTGNGSFAENYPGKQTEEALKHALELEPTVAKAIEKHAVYHSWCLRITNTMRSLQARLELIRSTEATRRKAFPS